MKSVIFVVALFSTSAWATLDEMPGDNEETQSSLSAPDSKTNGKFCPKCEEAIAEGQHGSISPQSRYQIVNSAGGKGGGSGDEGTN